MDMHRFKHQFESTKVRLWKSSLVDEDKNSIEFFLKDCRTKGIGYARLTITKIQSTASRLRIVQI